MSKYFSVLFLLLSIFIGSQIRITVVSLPENTPKNAKIYIASSLNGWKPDDENFLLKKNQQGEYFLEIPESKGSFEYKFTQGNWESSEADAHGKPAENRRLSFSGTAQNIENKILSWSRPAEKRSTASPNVKVLSENFHIPQLNTSRKMWIYLPPGYDSSKKKYPVIYMLDGQNIFDDATSFSGEWKVDETLDSFSKSGKTEAIVVGIDNGGGERLNEYSPWKNPQYGGGKGGLFTEFLVKTLKPFIDKNYRTLPQPKNTALIGSSMGGLISLYAGTRHPEVFGKLGIFSPAFWFAEKDLHQYLIQNKTKLGSTRFYFLGGKNEDENLVSDIEETVEILKKKNIPEKNILIKIDEDGTHTEGYWAREFPKALDWLFGKQQMPPPENSTF
ncbi:MAG: alpha/beta hydrolase-fold protein [Bergeyella sp.]